MPRKTPRAGTIVSALASALVVLALAAIASSALAASTRTTSGVTSKKPWPDATTNAASSISPTGATLNGTVKAKAGATSYYFEWGATLAYGTSTAVTAISGPGPAQAASATIGGLAPSTTYHFRVVATNGPDTTDGADQSFTTLPPAPVVTSGVASAVGSTTATLSAVINPGGSPTAYHFDVGPTATYGSRWPASDASVGSDDAPHSLVQQVSGLLPATTYHYRAVATNPSGTTYGADQSFTTPAPSSPAIPTSPSGAPPAPTPSSPLPPVAPPTLGATATITAVSGTVSVQLPGAAGVQPLSAASTVPVGTTIDATRGTVKLTNVRDATGKLQTATFWGGKFTVDQRRRTTTPTTLTLAPINCPKTARHTAAVDPRRTRVRQLWGRDNHGRFVTRGTSAVATVRGTEWLMRDTCAGSLVRVTTGSVSVRDLIRHDTIIVDAGHSYLARSHP